MSKDRDVATLQELFRAADPEVFPSTTGVDLANTIEVIAVSEFDLLAAVEGLSRDD